MAHSRIAAAAMATSPPSLPLVHRIACALRDTQSAHDVRAAHHSAAAAAAMRGLELLDAPGMGWARDYVWTGGASTAAADMPVLTAPRNLDAAVALTISVANIGADGHRMSAGAEVLLVPVLSVGENSVGIVFMRDTPKKFEGPTEDLDSATGRVLAELMARVSEQGYATHGRFLLNNTTGVRLPDLSPRARAVHHLQLVLCSWQNTDTYSTSVPDLRSQACLMLSWPPARGADDPMRGVFGRLPVELKALLPAGAVPVSGLFRLVRMFYWSRLDGGAGERVVGYLRGDLVAQRRYADAVIACHLATAYCREVCAPCAAREPIGADVVAVCQCPVVLTHPAHPLDLAQVQANLRVRFVFSFGSLPLSLRACVLTRHIYLCSLSG
jgi:hypothetical protein